MRGRNRLVVGMLAGLLCGFVASAAGADRVGEEKPIPDKPLAQQFEDVPSRWRDYLIEARAAERIEDPLQRCLAYPDWPGHQWPAGHAEAHCRFHAISVMDLAEIESYVRRGDARALHARMRAYLDKHFSGTDFGEDIHLVFGRFGSASEEADRVSAAWLALDPGSAYANLARGEYLRAMAWKARGAEWASETARENMRLMSQHAEEAIPFLRKALRIEPRLMPAHAGLLDIGMLDSRPALEREAVQLANRQDPACLYMARQRMQAAQPRWGGDYQDMLAIAAELSRHLDKRPLLAIHVAAPYGDRGDRMVAEEVYTREAAAILDVAVRSGSNESHLRDAAAVARNLPDNEGGPEPWKSLSLLLQESRFNTVSAWADRQIAWYLVRHEPEWSLRHALRAYGSEPDVGFGHYLLGAAYHNTRQFAAAEHHYLAAANDERQRRSSLRELSSMWLFNAGLEPKQAAVKARPFIDRLLAAYPDDGRGWLLRINEESVTNESVDVERLRAFLKVADRSDPWQAGAAAQIEAELDGSASSSPAPSP